jgi:hypothetical protein
MVRPANAAKATFYPHLDAQGRQSPNRPSPLRAIPARKNRDSSANASTSEREVSPRTRWVGDCQTCTGWAVLNIVAIDGDYYYPSGPKLIDPSVVLNHFRLSKITQRNLDVITSTMYLYMSMRRGYHLWRCSTEEWASVPKLPSRSQSAGSSVAQKGDHRERT